MKNKADKSLLPIAAVHDAYWAIEEKAAMVLLQTLRNTDAGQHRQEFEARGNRVDVMGGAEIEVVEGIAVVSIIGPMTKSPTSMDVGCSTVLARRQIRAAANDDRVRGILVRIDSPGGSISGTDDLANDVAMAARNKPVYAFAEDACCSAALWVASQATKVFASKTALVGSLGVFTSITDYTGMAEQMGMQVHVVASGKLKGAGTPGTAVEGELLAEIQATVDEFHNHFMGAVARGRGMTRANLDKIADGRTFVGEQAISVGLVDEVATFDEVFNALRQPRGSNGTRSMAKADAPVHDEDLPIGQRVDADGGFLVPKEVDAAYRKYLISVSGEGAPLAGMTLSDESEAALAVVRGLTIRIADLKATREAEGRKLGPTATGHLSKLLGEVHELREQIITTLDEAPDPRKKLAQLLLQTSAEENK